MFGVLAQTMSAADTTITIRDLVVLLAGLISVTFHIVQYVKSSTDRLNHEQVAVKISALELRVNAQEVKHVQIDGVLKDVQRLLTKIDKRMAVLADRAEIAEEKNNHEDS